MRVQVTFPNAGPGIIVDAPAYAADVIDRTRCGATLREEEWFTARGYVALGLFSAWVETPETQLEFGGPDDPRELGGIGEMKVA